MIDCTIRTVPNKNNGGRHSSGRWHIASHHGVDNDEPEGDEGEDGEDAMFALEPDSDEDSDHGDGDGDDDGGDF